MLILIFGDSITYGCWDPKGGWAARLREYIDQRNISDPDFYGLVYNLGVSGDTSSGLLERFENEIKSRWKYDLEEKAILIFAIGINDSKYTYSKKQHQIPLSQFRKNIKELIKKAKNYTDRIIFVGLTPVDEDKVDPMPWDTDSGYKNEYINLYDQQIENISKEKGVEYIRMRDLFEKERLENLLFEGLHPNEKGHELMYKRVLAYILR